MCELLKILIFIRFLIKNIVLLILIIYICKPVMSNDITNWQPLPNDIVLTGVVTEEKLG